MFFKKSTPVNARRAAKVTKSQAVSAKLVKEAWWLVLVLVGLYITVILFTYHPEDPSWSHMATENAVIQNSGGNVGAWLSDMMLYLFGFSAWWWAVLAFYAMWLVYLKLEAVDASEKPFLLFNFTFFHFSLKKFTFILYFLHTYLYFFHSVAFLGGWVCPRTPPWSLKKWPW